MVGKGFGFLGAEMVDGGTRQREVSTSAFRWKSFRDERPARISLIMAVPGRSPTTLPHSTTCLEQTRVCGLPELVRIFWV